ncbi:hypothetical protein BH11MYX2_BH11MYX2_13270 [soil metagenome]
MRLVRAPARTSRRRIGVGSARVSSTTWPCAAESSQVFFGSSHATRSGSYVSTLRTRASVLDLVSAAAKLRPADAPRVPAHRSRHSADGRVARSHACESRPVLVTRRTSSRRTAAQSRWRECACRSPNASRRPRTGSFFLGKGRRRALHRSNEAPTWARNYFFASRAPSPLIATRQSPDSQVWDRSSIPAPETTKCSSVIRGLNGAPVLGVKRVVAEHG